MSVAHSRAAGAASLGYIGLGSAELAGLLAKSITDADPRLQTAEHRGLWDRVFGLLDGRARTVVRLRVLGWTAKDLAIGFGLSSAVLDQIHFEAMQRLASSILANEELHSELRRVTGPVDASAQGARVSTLEVM